MLSYILQIVTMLQWMIRRLAEVENSMNATERIKFYGNLPLSRAELNKGAIRPSWPEHGEIMMRNVEMRYRDSLPLVRKNSVVGYWRSLVRGRYRPGILGFRYVYH